jgi:hypothetical protein
LSLLEDNSISLIISLPSPLHFFIVYCEGFAGLLNQLKEERMKNAAKPFSTATKQVLSRAHSAPNSTLTLVGSKKKGLCGRCRQKKAYKSLYICNSVCKNTFEFEILFLKFFLQFLTLRILGEFELGLDWRKLGDGGFVFLFL